MRATRSGRYLAQHPCGAGGTAECNESERLLKQEGSGHATRAAVTQSPTTTMSSQSSPTPGDDCDVELLSSLELAQFLDQNGHDQTWQGQLNEEMWKEDQSACLSDQDELPFTELFQQLVSYVKAEDKGISLPSNVTSQLNGKDCSFKLNGHYEAAKSNKNAMAARLNRLRKKEYVMGLESKVSRLSSENLELKEENQQLGKRVQELEDETKYLKAVLANESVLSQLLGRLTGVKGMRLTTSLFRENEEEMDHDYALPRKRVKVEEQESTSGGVCLHVDKEKVSVEFCSSCARNACSTVKIFFFR